MRWKLEQRREKTVLTAECVFHSHSLSFIAPSAKEEVEGKAEQALRCSCRAAFKLRDRSFAHHSPRQSNQSTVNPPIRTHPAHPQESTAATMHQHTVIIGSFVLACLLVAASCDEDESLGESSPHYAVLVPHPNLSFNLSLDRQPARLPR